jgi:hypothetical protein
VLSVRLLVIVLSVRLLVIVLSVLLLVIVLSVLLLVIVLSVLLLVIVLSVRRITDSDYPFGIFKHFLQLQLINNSLNLIHINYYHAADICKSK